MKQIKDLKVLIVDDEEDLLEVVEYELSSLGCAVHGANSIDKAFSYLQENQVDVVISDIRMPQGGGLELLDKIGAWEKELPPFMFMSAYADLTLEDAYDKGAVAIFGKPFNKKEIFETLLRNLLPLSERWKMREEQEKVPFRIKLSFDSLEEAAKAHQLSLGRGGFFYAFSGPENPSSAAVVDFDIIFHRGDIKTFKGRGIPRWVRRNPKSALPKGMGIEIQFLKDECRDAVINYVKKFTGRAFIPKN